MKGYSSLSNNKNSIADNTNIDNGFVNESSLNTSLTNNANTPIQNDVKSHGINDIKPREGFTPGRGSNDSNIEVLVTQPTPTQEKIYNIEEKKRLVGSNLITSILEDENISFESLVLVTQPLSQFINLTKTKSKVELTAMVLFSRYNAFYQRLLYKITGYNNGNIKDILNNLKKQNIISETKDDVITLPLKRLVFKTSKNKKNVKKIKFYVFNPPYSQLIKKFSNELYSLLPEDIKERIDKLDKVLSVSNSNIEKLNNRDEIVFKLLDELALYKRVMLKQYGGLPGKYFDAAEMVYRRLKDVYLLDIQIQDVEFLVDRINEGESQEDIIKRIRLFYI